MANNNIVGNAVVESGRKSGFLERFFSQKGRIGRSGFLIYCALNMAVIVLMNVLEYNLSYNGAMMIVLAWIFLLILIASLYSLIIVIVKRLHDLNKSGWEAFTIVIPFYNIYVIFLLFFYKGTTGSNGYGFDPLVHNA